MNAAERKLEVILAVPITIAAITTSILPTSTYERYRTPALILCRFTSAIMPSFKVLIKQMLQAETSLSRKWGQNRLGTIGLVLFTSRSLILGVFSVAMPLNFLPTLVVQIVIGAASWPTNLGLCSAKIASLPDVLLWLNAIHSFFSMLWGVCVPFFWTPLPPHNVKHPGVSLYAVTLCVQFFAVGFPVVQSVFRESRAYWHQLVARQQQQRRRQGLLSFTSFENINLTSNNSDDNDDTIDYIERYNRRHASSFYAAPNSTNTTTERLFNDVDDENRTAAGVGTSVRDYYFLPPSSHSLPDACYPEYKSLPLAAKICIRYQDLLQFPAHAVWLSAVVGSLLWTLSYTAAEKMCA
jgi:hypothetical protein